MTDENIIGELRRIAAENQGILRAESVVEAARDPASPLHERFEWTDSIAAEKYRVQQARQLIRVSVQLLQTGDEAKTQRVFVSLTTDRTIEGGGYRPLVDVLGDASLRSRLLADALKELTSFKQKYFAVKELAAVFSAIEEINRRHEDGPVIPTSTAGQEQHGLAQNGL